MIVLSVPDTINGAYVMRGAFRNALLITGRNVDPSGRSGALPRFDDERRREGCDLRRSERDLAASR